MQTGKRALDEAWPYRHSSSPGAPDGRVQVPRTGGIMRIFLAFLVAPLPAAILLGLLAGLHFGVFLLVRGVAALIVIAWLLQILPGIQIAVMLNRWRARSWWSYALAGAATYVLPAASYLLWRLYHPSIGLIAILVCTFLIVMLGAVTGVTFWLVMRPALHRTKAQMQIDELRAQFE
jgi:hypothetical protein